MKKLFTLLIVICACSFSSAQEIGLELVANGFTNPLEIQHAGDERLFIVEQAGRIKILNPDGSVNPNLFLNISSITSSGGERGLLGLAFHPNYADNGYFYVYYTNLVGNTQISRFSVSDTDPDVADPNSELQMLNFNQPFSNHNGGHIAFGPDGMLYISSGDGGSSGDPQNNSQTLSTLLGKLLRLDVDAAAPYIPADNPFVDDSSVRDEIWAYGLRNAWKFSFDSETNDLWIADVGQGAMEEINKEDYTEAGLNYGWRCYEGTLPYNLNGCPPADELTFPFAEYSRTGGRCSITGGYVYRGEEFPNMQGLYFFADLCSGDVGTVDQDGELTLHGSMGASSIVSFGTDINQNLYMAAFGGGSIFKIVDETPMSVGEHQSLNFVMYPNPANTVLTIDFNQSNVEKITVYDLNGRAVIQSHPDNLNSISLSVENLTAGMYLVEINTLNGKSQIKKLVVN